MYIATVLNSTVYVLQSSFLYPGSVGPKSVHKTEISKT